ncbi:GNAT family N-acetyltransferase [Peribacillus castrilensis]|uniref:GNAT family N-acetyltransferase n=1 Tax=Bacillaceae TaxID=186817 RepID=UPI000660D0AB|nr:MULTISPECIES: GNAT family N-acetyltransferase [Bacillaceae]MCT1390140.1 GNAT family N-acetyltransferase [Peribacillus frigoritolerans]NCT39962.1 GNAT family N-acetyltransferase [Peribacillus frigoritolerans]PRA81581.1 N-acetyltransferase [Peribacillus simplex]
MIEKASQSDLEEILTKSVDALFEGTAKTFKPSEERAEQIVRATLEQGGYYLVLKEDGDLKGWVLIGTSKDYFSQESVGFIYEMYVLPICRGKGLSKILMKAAIDELITKGHNEIRLNVQAKNFAKELYKEFGFVDRQISMSLKV